MGYQLFILTITCAFTSAALALGNGTPTGLVQTRHEACQNIVNPKRCTPQNFQLSQTIVATMKATCIKSFADNRCAELANEMDEKDRHEKLKTCDTKDLCEIQEPVEALKNCASGVARYGKDAWEIISSPWRAVESSLAERDACKHDLEKKLQMFNAYNFRVADALQMEIPPQDQIAKMECGEILSRIDNHYQATQRKLLSQMMAAGPGGPLSEELQDFKDWLEIDAKGQDAEFKKWIQDSGHATALAAGHLTEWGARAATSLAKDLTKWGIRANCYNQKTLTEMVCDWTMKYLVPDKAFRGAKFLWRLGKTSGSISVARAIRQAEKFDAATMKLAKAEANSVKSGRIARLETRAEVAKSRMLKNVGSLSDAERVLFAKSVLGRTLSEEQRAGLILIHNEYGKRGYFNLTVSELRAEKRDLMKLGFEASEADRLMRLGISGKYAGVEEASQELAKKLSDPLRGTSSELKAGVNQLERDRVNFERFLKDYEESLVKNDLPNAANQARLLGELAAKSDPKVAQKFFDASAKIYKDGHQNIPNFLARNRTDFIMSSVARSDDYEFLKVVTRTELDNFKARGYASAQEYAVTLYGSLKSSIDSGVVSWEKAAAVRQQYAILSRFPHIWPNDRSQFLQKAREFIGSDLLNQLGK